MLPAISKQRLLSGSSSSLDDNEFENIGFDVNSQRITVNTTPTPENDESENLSENDQKLKTEQYRERNLDAAIREKELQDQITLLLSQNASLQAEISLQKQEIDQLLLEKASDREEYETNLSILELSKINFLEKKPKKSKKNSSKFWSENADPVEFRPKKPEFVIQELEEKLKNAEEELQYANEQIMMIIDNNELTRAQENAEFAQEKRDLMEKMVELDEKVWMLQRELEQRK